MVFKKILGKEKKKDEKTPQELDVDDLIVLERYAEAEDRLKEQVKVNPKDLHAHLKLASVYASTGQIDKAVDEYAFVADEYADDGFYDKAVALLAKTAKMAPSDTTIPERMDRIEQLKRLEHSRMTAVEGLMQPRAGAAQPAMSFLEAQQLWMHLQEAPFLKGLPLDQVRRLFAATAVEKFFGRQIMFEAGQEKEVLYLVVRGQIEAVVEGNRGVTNLRSFGPGDVLGERALFEHQPWPTFYRSTEDTVVLRLDRAGLEQALLGNPDPRGLIDALRSQHLDRDVAAAIAKLEGSA